MRRWMIVVRRWTITLIALLIVTLSAAAQKSAGEGAYKTALNRILEVDRAQTTDLALSDMALETLFFPSACPQLNSQEHVWSQARATLSHNHILAELRRLGAAFLRSLGRPTFRFRWLEKYAPPALVAT